LIDAGNDLLGLSRMAPGGEAMRLLLIGLFVTIAAALAMAQEDPSPPPEVSVQPAGSTAAEPPSGRVGRVSLISGDVSVGTTDGWTEAVVNRPLAAGSTMRTGAQARAEIDFGTGAIDLSPDTQLTIEALNDQLVQVTILEGRIGLALRQLDGDEKVEIEVSGQGVQLVQPGRYDIDAATRRIAVLAGLASLIGSESNSDVAAGEDVLLAGSGPVTIAPAARDEFVDWCQSRASAAASLTALYYVSPYMTGFAELDAAGSWESTNEYGTVWVPHELPADWAPYRDGHWNWIMPWGWTWIDDQPWGFAPFHYGRWAFVGEHWAWAPGSFVTHPIFAPAVVAFLGTPSVGLSVADSSVPAVAWFPLAPGEAYWPAYTDDLDYVRRLNLGNVQDLEAIRLAADGKPPLEVFDQHFANRRFAGVVPRPIFVSGGAVAPAQLTLPEQRLENAPVLMGSPQIGPATSRVAVAASPAPRSAARAAWTGHIAELVARNVTRTKALQAAFARRHDRGAAAQVRGAHLRAPAYAGTVRHTIVLKVAHVARASRR
jgi:hypothetical protein